MMTEPVNTLLIVLIVAACGFAVTSVHSAGETNGLAKERTSYEALAAVSEQRLQ